jgi:hypothetical protein
MGGDWQGWQLHSLDVFDFLRGGIGTFSWEIGNVQVVTDNAGGADYRIYIGVLPGTLATQGVDSADLWWNTSGGLFLLMEFESAIPGSVNLQLFGVDHGKASETFPANNGSSTLIWDWANEVVEIGVDLDGENVVVKRDGIPILSKTWAAMGITPGGIGGLFEGGAWGFHYGSNYATGRGGHEMFRPLCQRN